MAHQVQAYTAPHAEHKSAPRLRPKPSSSKLRSAKTTLTRTGPPANLTDTGISVISDARRKLPKTRQERPSGLPKPNTPVERSMTPGTTKPHNAPPTRHHSAFSLGRVEPVQMARGQDGASSNLDAPSQLSESGKRLRPPISRKTSANGTQNSYTLGGTLRTGANASFNGSAVSPSTSTSSLGGPRHASHTSVLGITPPATSSTPRFVRKLSEGDVSNVPRVTTRELSTPVYPESDSSPSTRFTDSPGKLSHASTPTSVSSASSAPVAMFKDSSHRFIRSPVTPAHEGRFEFGTHETMLGSVRESTTSTSSGSTVKAGENNSARTPPNFGRTNSNSPRLQAVSSPSDTSSPSPGISGLSAKGRKLAPSPHFQTSKLPAPAAGSTSRKTSASSIASKSSNHAGPEAPVSGLGLTIPSPGWSGGNAPPRSRSKSLGSTGLQLRPKASATPPPPSPGLPLEGFTSSLSREHTPGPTDRKRSASPRKLSVPTESSHRRTPSWATREDVSRSNTPVSASNKSAQPSKIGFFSRVRGKTASIDTGKEKSIRKGPAAGTGHEGYGSFSKTRGRSGSASSTSGSYVRSGSQSSAYESRGTSASRRASRTSTVETEMDDYLLDRLKPVVILGGGGVESRSTDSLTGILGMSRTGSSDQGSMQSLSSGPSGSLSINQPSPWTTGSNSSRETLETEANLFRQTAGYKRMRTPIPSPIITSGRRMPVTPSPVTSSFSSSRKPSIDSQAVRNESPDPALPFGKDWDQTAELAPTTKTPRRWNFFQRAHAPKVTTNIIPPTPQTSKSVPNLTGKRPAHYALLDQEEQREAAHLAEQLALLRQKQAAGAEITSQYTHTLRRQESVHSPVSFSEASQSEVSLHGRQNSESIREEVRQAMATQRKRLQLEQSEASMQTTHSEPKTQKPELPPLQTRVLDVDAEDNRSLSPTRERPHVFSKEVQEFQVNWDSFGLTPTSPKSRPLTSKGFFEYDPLDLRGKRAVPESTTDDSDTPVAVNASAEWPVRNESKTEPLESFPVPLEEDIWDEYDELLDTDEPIEVPAPVKLDRSVTVTSTTSSLGAPFQYADDISPQLSFAAASPIDEEADDEEEEGLASIEQGIYALDSPTIPATVPQTIIPEILPLASAALASSAVESPLSSGKTATSSPFSISSFIKSYNDFEPKPVDMLKEARPKSIDASSQRGHKSKPSNGSVSSNGSCSGIAAIDEMKIRPWALLASRWLSFDRVLVSPAHDRLQQSGDFTGRILVIDGLGIDDWSFYCARTYPCAKVYNLTQVPVGPDSNSSPCSSPSASKPPNHHQVHHPSFTTAFPFPKGFFDSVCFRFLPSSSDSHWPYILTECKRVLRNGGYLEATVLDADMIRTGCRAKRAVDLVKAIMERENGMSSRKANRPASEKVLRILEKRGFEDVRKCFVGLPVVGKVDTSETGAVAAKRVEHSTREPSPEDPDAIYEVVSKVGRWWFTKIYESVITDHGEAPNRSMWNDKALLRECAKKRTNFKMMICYARKSSSSRTGRGTHTHPETAPF